MLARNSLHKSSLNGHELYRPTIEHVNLRMLDSSLSVASRSTVFGSEHTPRYSATGESASRDSLFKLIVVIALTTSAETVGVRSQRPAVPAAAVPAALGAIPRQLARRVRSAGTFPDRRRVSRPSALPRAIRVTRRLSERRRAAGWSCRRADTVFLCLPDRLAAGAAEPAAALSTAQLQPACPSETSPAGSTCVVVERSTQGLPDPTRPGSQGSGQFFEGSR